MEKLLYIVIYILKNYPNPIELSKPRLVKIIYLIDWKFCLSHQRQLTNISWYFDHFGPYVNDVINLIENNPEIFESTSYPTIQGYTGHNFKLRETAKNIPIQLTPEEIKIVDFVLNKTYKLNWNLFIDLVYSTYPIQNTSRYTTLNLIDASREYSATKITAASVQ